MTGFFFERFAVEREDQELKPIGFYELHEPGPTNRPWAIPMIMRNAPSWVAAFAAYQGQNKAAPVLRDRSCFVSFTRQVLTIRRSTGTLAFFKGRKHRYLRR